MLDPIFCDDFIEATKFATDRHKHYRTIHRWMDLGLPYVKLGAKRYVHLPSARDWLLRQVRRANPAPRRPARRGAP
jgi:hypothetical protein